MAKQIEEFTKEFAAIQSAVDAGLTEIKKNAQIVAHLTGVMAEGAKEIGLQVQELKSKGHTGKALNDFLADPGVKAAKAEVDGLMSKLEAELNRMKGLSDGAFLATKNRFWALKKALQAEIADRKKSLTTAFGGNKSLPDMEKLLAALNTYTDGPFITFDSFVPEVASEHKTQLTRQINEELAKTKEAALSGLQQQMDEQALNVRNLNKNVLKAKNDLALVEGECKKVAAAKGAPKVVTAAKAAIAKPLKELDELAGMYERGMADQWIKARIQGSKDKGAIEAGVKTIKDAKTKAHAEKAKAKL